MAIALLIVAALADLALAALLIGVSGFLFGGGPESMHAGGLAMAAYAAAVIACIAAPVAGFFIKRNGKSGFGVLVAWLPPAGALLATMMPAPY
ncbi:MAG TPA: hypothetical protein VG986_02720 [Pseudolabrys sp.]|nr:hypothetical protein [Pseudolabrys sp.]